MSCFVYPAQSGNLGRAALTQPRAQPSPADVQGQHPKSISHLVFSCWGSPEIDGDSIFIPGGKEGKCAVRKEPNQPQDTIPSFSDLPFQSRAAWQLHPDPPCSALAFIPWEGAPRCLFLVFPGCVGGSDPLCSLNNSERSLWKDTGQAELLPTSH